MAGASIAEQPDYERIIIDVFDDRGDEHSPEAFRADIELERATADAITRTLLALQPFRRGDEH